MVDQGHSDALLDEVSELFTILVRIARRAPDEVPMNSTQRLALLETARAGSLRISRLAALMDTTAATATRAVDALEQQSLVERRADPDDGRGVVVVPTARGKRWADRRRALIREAFESLPAAVIPERLVRDLATLNAALGPEHLVARAALLVA